MTSRRLDPSSLLCGLLLLGALLSNASPVEAQALVRFGRGSASLALPVTLEVPILLKVAAAGGERVVGHTGTSTEIELPVRVDANLGWSLTVALGAASELGPVLIRSVNGEWVELRIADPRTVLTGNDPVSAVEVRVRLRLPAGMDSTAPLRLRLSLVPSELAGA